MGAHKTQVVVPARRRILIVDDHPLTRRGMAQLIGQQTDLETCGEAGDAHQALAAISALRPHLVLMDVSLPGKHGLELIKDIRALHPQVLVLVVSMHEESLFAERALRAGARGYLMKNEGGEKLIEAVRQVLAGKLYVSSSMSASILDVFAGRPRRGNNTLLGALTDREFEVFQFVGEGLTTREIGERLHMSGKTVETHRLHIREKLGLKTGPELIKYAVRWASSRLS
ncbi:Two component transcriptional regulator, LuxR family [Verrucomicrobia bacterium]|nr:Two component transcriptional regulator, LuxR family [Verrucomicrobiota bacterium]